MTSETIFKDLRFLPYYTRDFYVVREDEALARVRESIHIPVWRINQILAEDYKDDNFTHKERMDITLGVMIAEKEFRRKFFGVSEEVKAEGGKL